MEYLRQLPNGEEIKKKFALSVAQKQERKRAITAIQNILSGKDGRKIVCVGPCSADNEVAVLDYMERIAKLNEKVKEQLFIIPRIYTSKPRTTGQGYKGLLHRPNAQQGDSIYDGIVAMRNLHLHIIQQTGLFGCDEMLYPDATYFIDDLLLYVAIGARSVENQQHRLVASGYDIPVGMKNPMSGDFSVLLNAIIAAQSEQSLLYHGWECHTFGNPFAHAILRGFVDASGKCYPNYHYEDLARLHDMYIQKNLQNIGVVIDCNHSNSNKHYDEQIRIAKDVFDTCRYSTEMNKFIKGVMIESYIEDGCQMVDEGVYGKSITDPCLGWEKTKILIEELANSKR